MISINVDNEDYLLKEVNVNSNETGDKLWKVKVQFFMSYYYL